MAARGAAQQKPKIRHVGIIDDTSQWNAFRSRLRELGYLEGENIAFDYASGEGGPERLAEAAAQLPGGRLRQVADDNSFGYVSDHHFRYERSAWARTLRAMVGKSV